MGSYVSLCAGCMGETIIQQPFFEGQILEGRMKLIREQFIEPIRAKYSKALFLRYINYLFKDHDPQFINKVQFHYWDDDVTENNRESMQFKLISAFTEEQIYQNIMKPKLNSILRKQPLPNSQEVQATVFLVQAINIQLFLLTKCKPLLHNFQGQVFRGINCSTDDYKKFVDLMPAELEKRVISVPLSLWSASTNFNVARGFAGDSDENRVAIILVINVIQMIPEDLVFYQEQYPTSIVSTICAVNIKEISSLKAQSEVLLRGAFCLILKIQDNLNYLLSVNQLEIKKKYTKIHCVMVNSNRDHISTNFLGSNAQPARDLFAAMAKKSRAKFAKIFLGEEEEDSGKFRYFENLQNDEETKIVNFKSEYKRMREALKKEEK